MSARPEWCSSTNATRCVYGMQYTELETSYLQLRLLLAQYWKLAKAVPSGADYHVRMRYAKRLVRAASLWSREHHSLHVHADSTFFIVVAHVGRTL